MARQLQQALKHGPPSWMTNGRTVLIMKDRPKGPIPTNFRPITCLSVIWKLLTAILSKKVYQHLKSEDLIPCEQKGCTQASRASKDQLLIDRTILKEAKARHKNLELIWVDYAKAYDSVPHSWIMECLILFKIHPSVVRFMDTVMNMWKTKLFLNNTSLGYVDV